MTDPNVTPPDRGARPSVAQGPSGRIKGGGLILALMAMGLVVVGVLIGLILKEDGRPLAPEPPRVDLNLHLPSPSVPQVPDRPVPREMPPPLEKPNVAAQAAPASASAER